MDAMEFQERLARVREAARDSRPAWNFNGVLVNLMLTELSELPVNAMGLYVLNVAETALDEMEGGRRAERAGRKRRRARR